MVTMAQRLEALRIERGISRPALSAALGFPKTAMEKFETGRQTPTQDQQRKLADYFSVTLPYLRGESDDPAEGDSWLSGNVPAEEPLRAPAAPPVSRKPRPTGTMTPRPPAAGRNPSPLLELETRRVPPPCGTRPMPHRGRHYEKTKEMAVVNLWRQGTT